jgi:hypothetical protein
MDCDWAEMNIGLRKSQQRCWGKLCFGYVVWKSTNNLTDSKYPQKLLISPRGNSITLEYSGTVIYKCSHTPQRPVIVLKAPTPPPL